jgi:Flp pilus assembly protein TadD
LEAVQKQLNESDARAASANESLKKEVTVLRSIVDRQLKEQARREVAKRMALDELKSLGVESSKLKTQLDILGSPLVELTEEEKSLLRAPTAALAGDEAGSFSAPLTEAGADFANRPRVPSEFKDLAREANELFAAQKFDEAAAKYQTILNTYPDSLYALSNIAVVRFQQANYKEAEVYLRKAVVLAPQDAFSHSILGIALYQQAKYDEAVQMLSRAIALDPNDPKTRNYLGISASQKGWQEAAEQECRKAIELDPNYGDAHFNLAVIYATQKPPAMELARRHYNRAIELGIPRDQQLEAMLK